MRLLKNKIPYCKDAKIEFKTANLSASSIKFIVYV